MTTEHNNSATPAAVVTKLTGGEEMISSASRMGDDSSEAQPDNASSDSKDVDEQEPNVSATDNKPQQNSGAETTTNASSSSKSMTASSSSSVEQKSADENTRVPANVSSSNSIPEGETEAKANEEKSLTEHKQGQPSPPSSKPVKDPIQEEGSEGTLSRPKLVPLNDPPHTIQETDKTHQQTSSSSHQRVPYNDSLSIGSAPSGLDASTNSGGGGSHQINHSFSQEAQQRPKTGAQLYPSTPTPPPLTIANSNVQTQTPEQLTKSTSSHSTATTPRQGIDHQVTENQQERQNIPLAPQLNTATAATTVQTEEQQTKTHSHPPVALVALPVQQNSSEQLPLQPQHLPPVTEAGAEGYAHQQQAQQHHQQGQPEQTIYYQIPSVVTIGHTASQDSQSNAVNVGYTSHNHEEHHQQYSSGLQQSNLPQQQLQEGIQNPPEQVIGMVGAIPIVKLQTGSLHLVKKKKGRFKLLGDTPPVATANAAFVGGAPVVPVGVVSSSQHAGTTTTGGQQQLPSNTTFIPTNITIPMTTQQGQSMSSTISQHSGNAGAVQAPQTFDGTSAPTVKKKGRFVVTNVKDPGSIPLNIKNPQQSQQHQQQHPSTAMGDQQQQASQWDAQQNSNQGISVSQQQQQHQQQPVRQRENSHQNLQQTSSQQNTTVPQHERDGSSLPSMSEIPRGPPQQQLQQSLPHMSQAPGPHAVDSYHAQVFIHQPATLYQQEKVGGGPESVQQQMSLAQPPPPPPVTNQVVTMDGLSQIQNNQGVDSGRLQTVFGQYLTPPQTPSTTGASAPNSPRQQRTAQSMIPPTAAAIPKAPQTNADRTRNSESRKKPVQAGTGKLPQTIDKNGSLSAGGLGKVFYLLDQMKNEVTGADRTIKTLQTDMKLMRDKNKELEAKVRELESKVKEEKSLREKAEARNIELRKRIRDTAKGEVVGGKQVDQPPDEGKTVRSKEASVTEKQVIADVGKEKASNGPSASNMTPGTGQGNPQALSAAGNASVSGSSDLGRAPIHQKSGNLPPKSTASHNRPKGGSVASSGENQMKNGTNLSSGGKHTRSHSYHPESSRSALNVRSIGSEAVQATPSKGSSTPNTWPNENPGQAGPSRPPPVYPSSSAGGQNGGSNAQKAQRVSDFDPLKPKITSSGLASHQSEMMSIISLSALEAVPINPAAAYTNAGTNFTAQLNHGSFLSETNQYVVPITLGMAPATAVGHTMNGEIHRTVPNAHGFHEQPIMVLPQQQPIMFQQFGGMQPVNNMMPTGPSANTIQMHQPSAYYHQNQTSQYDHQRQSQQSPCHNNAGSGPNPFDAFSTASDPFDDIVPRQLPPNQVT